MTDLDAMESQVDDHEERIRKLEAELAGERRSGERGREAYRKLAAENARLREAILWACGVRGEFPIRQDGQGAYYWRRELRMRAGISGEELNREALEGGDA